MHQNNNINHEPVLLTEVLTYLKPRPGEIYLDLTAGYGGHAEAILDNTQNAPAVLVDRDQNAINYLSSKFKDPTVEIVKSDFLSVSLRLRDRERQFDLILADLGVSSPHLNMANRGFSLRAEGPLDMRMDQGQSLTADEIVNSYAESDLAKIIRAGEEPRAVKIANAIVVNRPIKSTVELAELVAKTLRRGRGKIHPATRTFQALRIAVNDELSQLEQALPIWIDLLKPGGRIAVISFHSLEDRLVKQAFKDTAGQRYDATLKLLTKSPVTAKRQELAFNPRARSAKLRAAVKIKTKKGSFHANSGKKHLPSL